MPRKMLDQEMQELHAQVMHTGSLVEETLAKATHLFWIAQKLKQFADHTKKICKRVIYIVEGESSID